MLGKPPGIFTAHAEIATVAQVIIGFLGRQNQIAQTQQQEHHRANENRKAAQGFQRREHLRKIRQKTGRVEAVQHPLDGIDIQTALRASDKDGGRAIGTADNSHGFRSGIHDYGRGSAHYFSSRNLLISRMKLPASWYRW